MDAEEEYFQELHSFFERQAGQTRPLRRFLYRKAGLARKKEILDAGCGTGVLTREMSEKAKGRVVGVDRESAYIEYARNLYPGIDFFVADCGSLPFEKASFDLVAFHFLLMWVEEPEDVIIELAGVLEPGGILLACAEPDYGGRVEYPENPEYAKALESSLERKGSDPRAGRKLVSLFRNAGLTVEAGISSTLLTGEELACEFDSNRSTYERDLSGILDDAAGMRSLELERRQIEEGKVLTVPIFWAIGRKPDTEI